MKKKRRFLCEREKGFLAIAFAGIGMSVRLEDSFMVIPTIEVYYFDELDKFVVYFLIFNLRINFLITH